jgi:hypothetical protein
MRDLLDDDLAELYPVRSTEDDVRLARLREQLFAEPPRRRSRAWAGIAAAVIGVVMIAGLVVHLRPKHETPVAEMPTAPATSLLEAAALLDLAQPRGAYRHIRYENWETVSFVLPDQNWGAMQVEFTIDVWLPTAKGQRVETRRKATGRQRPIPGVTPGEADLGRVYTGPTLWDTTCPTTPCHETSLLNPLSPEPRETLGSGWQALLSPFTTGDRKAALYRGLAAIPGIRYDNGVVSAEGGDTVFTIDPKSGEIVGAEKRKLVGDSRLPAGAPLMSVTMSYDWTDRVP